MGLDIYKRVVCTPDDDDASEMILGFEETNKSIIALFEHFSDYVYERDVKHADFQPLLDTHGMVEIKGISYGDDVIFTGVNAQGEVFDFIVEYDDIPHVFIHCKCMKYKEIGYQRKGMNKQFYTEWLSGCWYVAESERNDDEAEIVIFSNERLKQCKKYCDDGQPFKNWSLTDKEYVAFSY